MSIRGKWFITAALILVISTANSGTADPTATAPTTTARHGDPELQQKRRAFIKNTVKTGLISNIEDKGPVTHVRVGHGFMSLSFEEKEDIVNIIWAYYKTENPQKDDVVVIDRESGKVIGKYSLANGGLKMK